MIKEVIDLYQPDLLYSDGGLPFASAWDKTDASLDDPLFTAGLQAVAHLYNMSAAANGGVNRAVYNQKDRRQDVYRIGILDIERSQEPDIKPEPWQTDTCVGDWFYHVKTEYKTGARHRNSGRYHSQERQPAPQYSAEAGRYD